MLQFLPDSVAAADQRVLALGARRAGVAAAVPQAGAQVRRVGAVGHHHQPARHRLARRRAPPSDRAQGPQRAPQQNRGAWVRLG